MRYGFSRTYVEIGYVYTPPKSSPYAAHTSCPRLPQGLSEVIQCQWLPSAVSVVRFFPAAGNSNGNQGTNGNYWSATENSSDNAYNMNFNSSNVNVNNNNKTNAFAVRLFASEQDDLRVSGVTLPLLFLLYRPPYRSLIL